MKKKVPGHQLQRNNRWMYKFGFLVMAAVFVFFMFKLQMQFRAQLTSNHANLIKSLSSKPKLAFLFLARNRLPLDFMWQQFFKEAEEPNFSIYIHSRPGFVYNEITTVCTFCYGRQLSDSIQVLWGEASMIEAERILLRKALEDPANQRFILVSDSCVPLYNFSYTYNYVMSSSKSFVDSFVDPKSSRYNPKMAPTIRKDKWRKGSQWVTLIRKHAEVMVSDKTIFPVFRKHCKRRPLLPEHLRKQAQPRVVQKEHDCIPDEHYVQTLLAMRGLEEELERRTLTYTLWNQSTNKIDMQGWHPVTFKHADVGARLIKNIKGIDHVYYGTEFRTEWCRSNGKSLPCFLFARKFSRSAAMKLLNLVKLENDTMQFSGSKLEPVSLAKVNFTSLESSLLPGN